MAETKEEYLAIKQDLINKINESQEDYLMCSSYEMELEYLEMWNRLFLD